MSGRRRNKNFDLLKFSLIKVNNKYAAKCLVCNNVIKNTAADRLQAHRNVCIEKSHNDSHRLRSQPAKETSNNADKEDSLEVLTYDVLEDGILQPVASDSHVTLSSNSESFPEESCSYTSEEVNLKRSYNSPSPSTSTPKKKTRKISDFLDRLSEQEEEDINDALAKFIFGCSLPFSIVESPLFKNFIKSLRPAYADRIPGRKKLSSTLLNKCYDDCIKKVNHAISEESVILCDGWKNSSNNTKTVVTMLHTTDGIRAFIDAWDVSEESETGEKLAAIVTESKEIAKQKYNVDTYCTVSDNASAMIKMGNLLKHAMWHSTCSSHTGNLLAKDVLDKNLVDNTVLILKEFKQVDFERMIVTKGGHRIKLPADTRWCSYRDSFKNLLDNLCYMKEILAITKKKVKPKVKELVFNDEFIENVQTNLDIQDSICNLVNICQKPNTSIADAANLWINLELPENFNYYLKNRQSMALNVYALTAYFFHPKYDNKKLSNSQKKSVHEFLFKHLDSNGIEEWDKFNTKKGVFKVLYEKNVQQPLVFWRMAKLECPTLSELVIKLLKIPAASANIERLFSNWGFIHNTLRNRLTFDKSKKLVHIYFQLKEEFHDSNEVDEENEEYTEYDTDNIDNENDH